MVAQRRRTPNEKGRLLSQTLRALRKLRQKRTAEIAEAMGLPPRTYEHFEGGKGRLNVDRVHTFATLLGVDPYGVLTAVEIASPLFAVRTANNKLMTIFTIALQDFDARTGDAIANLDAYVLMDAFAEMFDKLAEAAGAPDGMIKRWKGRKESGDTED